MRFSSGCSFSSFILTLLSDDLVSSLQANNKMSLNIRRRFQFSSALKRMCTVSTFQGPSVIGGVGGSTNRTLVAVKGAPETIKTMLAYVPEGYDDTYKWYTRRGSRVLALGVKEIDSISHDRVCPFASHSNFLKTHVINTLDRASHARRSGK